MNSALRLVLVSLLIMASVTASAQSKNTVTLQLLFKENSPRIQLQDGQVGKITIGGTLRLEIVATVKDDEVILIVRDADRDQVLIDARLRAGESRSRNTAPAFSIKVVSIA